jgi:acetyl esterase/lipase
MLLKKHLLFLFFAFYLFSAKAQLTSGLTQKPDTSYSNYSAFQSTRKKYPQIILVKEASSPKVKEQRNLVYCSIGNRDLHLDAFSPKTKKGKKLPAILIIHGGGWRSGNRTQHIPLAQKLAASGYVCFTVEYRLSTEALYPAAVDDLKSALRWMHTNARKFNIDTSKIAALGFSAGGELAALIGTTRQNPGFEGTGCNSKNSSNVNAVVDIDGTLSFVHPESGEGNDTKSISASTYWFGYNPKTNFSLLKEASPLTHGGKNTPPFLFLNSSIDRMHAGRDDFRKVLDQYHIYSEVHAFPDSPHGFCLFEPWFTPTVNYIVAFLGKVF